MTVALADGRRVLQREAERRTVRAFASGLVLNIAANEAFTQYGCAPGCAFGTVRTRLLPMEGEGI